jgi:hypothetical protein
MNHNDEIKDNHRTRTILDPFNTLTPEEHDQIDRIIAHLLEEEQNEMSVAPPLEPHPKVKAFYNVLRPEDGWKLPQHSIGRTYEDMRKTAQINEEIQDCNFLGFRGFEISEMRFNFLHFSIFTILLISINFFLISGFYHFLRFTVLDPPMLTFAIFGISAIISGILGFLIIQGDE